MGVGQRLGATWKNYLWPQLEQLEKKKTVLDYLSFEYFIYLFEGECKREITSRGEGQSEKQTPHRAGSPRQNTIPGPQDCKVDTSTDWATQVPKVILDYNLKFKINIYEQPNDVNKFFSK